MQSQEKWPVFILISNSPQVERFTDKKKINDMPTIAVIQWSNTSLLIFLSERKITKEQVRSLAQTTSKIVNKLHYFHLLGFYFSAWDSQGSRSAISSNTWFVSVSLLVALWHSCWSTITLLRMIQVLLS